MARGHHAPGMANAHPHKLRLSHRQLSHAALIALLRCVFLRPFLQVSCGPLVGSPGTPWGVCGEGRPKMVGGIACPMEKLLPAYFFDPRLVWPRDDAPHREAIPDVSREIVHSSEETCCTSLNKEKGFPVNRRVSEASHRERTSFCLRDRARGSANLRASENSQKIEEV